MRKQHMQKKKQSWGGKREGAGRKKEVVRMPSPYVLPDTEKKIKELKKTTGKTFGELLDDQFNSPSPEPSKPRPQ